MQEKSKIEYFRFKDEKGWKRIKDTKAEVPQTIRDYLDPIMDKFGCEILAVREAK